MNMDYCFDSVKIINIPTGIKFLVREMIILNRNFELLRNPVQNHKYSNRDPIFDPKNDNSQQKFELLRNPVQNTIESRVVRVMILRVYFFLPQQ